MLRIITLSDTKCFRYVVYKEKLLCGRWFEDYRRKAKFIYTSYCYFLFMVYNRLSP